MAQRRQEVRIGRDTAAPTLRVRALKYVIAGAASHKTVEAYRSWLLGRGVAVDETEKAAAAFARTPREGWRALTVFDLTQSWGLPEDLQWMRTSRSMTASL